MNEPESGFTTKAIVTKIVDGDTIRVKVEREFNIRMVHPNNEKLEFNAPEKATKEGVALIDWLRPMVGDTVTIFIPSKNPVDLIDFNSFNRVLGVIWYQGTLLTQRMLDCGFAKLLKKNSY